WHRPFGRPSLARRAVDHGAGRGRGRPAASQLRRARALGRHRSLALFPPRGGTDGGLRVRLDLTILYRGTLSSCNYDCPYCPFAKHWESPAELAADRRGLARFVDWVSARTDDRLALFFTPWGEALVRQWYR